MIIRIILIFTLIFLCSISSFPDSLPKTDNKGTSSKTSSDIDHNKIIKKNNENIIPDNAGDILTGLGAADTGFEKKKKHPTPAGNSILKKGKDAVKKAKDTLKKAAQNANNAKKAFKQSASNVVKKAENAVKKAIKDPSNAKKVFKQSASEAAKKAKDAVKKATQNANNAKKAFKQNASNVAKKAKDAVKKATQNASNAKKVFKQSASEAAKKAKNAVKKATQNANNAKKAFKQNASNVAKKAKDAFKKAIKDPSNAKKAFKQSVGNVAKNAKNTILNNKLTILGLILTGSTLYESEQKYKKGEITKNENRICYAQQFVGTTFGLSVGATMNSAVIATTTGTLTAVGVPFVVVTTASMKISEATKEGLMMASAFNNEELAKKINKSKTEETCNKLLLAAEELITIGSKTGDSNHFINAEEISYALQRLYFSTGNNWYLKKSNELDDRLETVKTN